MTIHEILIISYILEIRSQKSLITVSLQDNKHFGQMRRAILILLYKSLANYLDRDISKNNHIKNPDSISD